MQHEVVTICIKIRRAYRSGRWTLCMGRHVVTLSSASSSWYSHGRVTSHNGKCWPTSWLWRPCHSRLQSPPNGLRFYNFGSYRYVLVIRVSKACSPVVFDRLFCVNWPKINISCDLGSFQPRRCYSAWFSTPHGENSTLNWMQFWQSPIILSSLNKKFDSLFCTNPHKIAKWPLTMKWPWPLSNLVQLSNRPIGHAWQISWMFDATCSSYQFFLPQWHTDRSTHT